MYKNSKIYVAGHTGMVGSAIVDELKRNDYKNLLLKTSSELDLRDQKATEEFLMSEKPDHVFLAAAKVGGIVANSTYQAEFIYDNLAIAMNVINASYKAGVRKLLNLGSSCIYPKYAEQPMKEDMLLTGKLESTNEPYAIAKIAAIKLCKYYNEQYKTNYISLMPTNLYGCNDNYNMETSHVLPALIRKIYLGNALMNEDYNLIVEDAKRYPLGFNKEINEDSSVDDIKQILSEFGIFGDRLILWGSGTAKREFINSRSLAKASLYFMINISHLEMGDFVNIGSGIDLSIKALANIIRNKIGYKGNIVFDNEKPDGTPRKLLDISKAQSLGWNVELDLDEGLEEVIKFYITKQKPDTYEKDIIGIK